MPRRKKRVTELPTEEAVRKLFPKKAVEVAKEVAHERDDKPAKKPRQ